MLLDLLPSHSSSAAAPPALLLRGVEVAFPGGLLLNIRHLRIAGGERALIHGPSGLGKTTLLHLMAGLLKPRAGEIHVGGQSLGTLSEAHLSQLRRRLFGVIFQTLNLIDHLTPVENIELALVESRDARQRALDALAQVGMESYADANTAVLSLGQRQRIAVARVVAAKPRVILADEPTSSLDQDNADLIMDALFKAAANATLIVVSHDLRVRSRFAKTYAISEVLAR